MDPVDEALTRVILTRRIESLGDAAARLPPKFISDLDQFLKNEVGNPSRWMALGMSLGDAGLTIASNHAFSETLYLVDIPTEQSKVLLEWARRDEAGGRIPNAVGRYYAAYRCDPRQAGAMEKVKEIGATMVPRIMVGAWDAFGALNDPAEFRRMRALGKFSANDADMLRNDFSRGWYFTNRASEARIGAPLDCSFIVTKAARPVLFVPCTIRGHSQLCCYEVPILPTAADDADEADLPIAYDFAMNYIDALARYVGTPLIQLEEPDVRVLTPVSLFAAKRKSETMRLERHFIDLTRSEADIWKDVRKGHKHAINAGKKMFEIETWDGVDEGKIAEMMTLYERSRRASAFNNADDVRSIWNGEKGTLSFAYRNGEMVAAIGINYEGDQAYYTSSVSLDHDETPATHWPLYHAVLKAKERGVRTFSFGYLEVDQAFDAKKRAIARFKSGFTAQYTCHRWWYCDPVSRA
jgi:hypothetical protein